MPEPSVDPRAKFVIVSVSPSPSTSLASASLDPLVTVIDSSFVLIVILSSVAVTTSLIPVTVKVIAPMSKAFDPALVSSSFTLYENVSVAVAPSARAIVAALPVTS